MNQRKSLFAGATPVVRHDLPTSPPPVETPQHVETPRRADTQRWTLQMPVELVEKTRSAWMVDGVPRGIRNMSAWVAEVLAAEIDRVEKAHGPLAKTPPGVVPSGWDAHQ